MAGEASSAIDTATPFLLAAGPYGWAAAAALQAYSAVSKITAAGKAKKANEMRQQKILAYLRSSADASKTDVARDASNQRSDIQQSLASRGLYNTGVLDSLTNQTYERQARESSRIDQESAKNQASIMSDVQDVGPQGDAFSGLGGLGKAIANGIFQKQVGGDVTKTSDTSGASENPWSPDGASRGTDAPAFNSYGSSSFGAPWSTATGGGGVDAEESLRAAALDGSRQSLSHAEAPTGAAGWEWAQNRAAKIMQSGASGGFGWAKPLPDRRKNPYNEYDYNAAFQ